MAVQTLANLCGDEEAKWKNALAAARLALNARIAFWDGVVEQIDIARSHQAMKAKKKIIPFSSIELPAILKTKEPDKEETIHDC
jgi:hypothetical protein